MNIEYNIKIAKCSDGLCININKSLLTDELINRIDNKEKLKIKFKLYDKEEEIINFNVETKIYLPSYYLRIPQKTLGREKIISGKTYHVKIGIE